MIKGDAPYVRFVQIDVLRGFAVLGIYWINIYIFAMPDMQSLIPPELNEDSLVNSTIKLVGDVYIEGTMRALFSMLFGASALIFLDEAKLSSSGLDLVDRYHRRTLLLILFGLIHAYLLLWPYDVLYAYGLFGLFLFPMRKLSARTLLICGLLLLILGDLDFNTPHPDIENASPARNVSPGNHQVLPLQEVTADTNVQPSDTESSAVVSSSSAPVPTPDQESGVESIDIVSSDMSIGTYRSGYATIFKAQRKLVVEKQSVTIYQNYIFDIGGMMLFGMALFKWGVLIGKLTSRFYIILAITGYVVGAAIRYTWLSDSGGSSSVLNWSMSYNLGRLAITLGHVGLIGWLCSCARIKSAIRLIASVGRMALTNYIMQTVISIFLFYGVGFALYAELERYQLAIMCVGIWIVQITYSNLWLIWYKQGPLEWLWRSMIYGRIQPNRRNAEARS